MGAVYVQNAEHLDTPDSKEAIKDDNSYVKSTQKPVRSGFRWSKMRQSEFQKG